MARYVSLEQRILDSKNIYYTSLQQSQRGWHEGHHSIWPWTTYLAGVLADAYDAFERQIAAEDGQASGKQDRVRDYVLHRSPHVFKRRDVQRALPDVSAATVRLVLAEMRDAGQVTVHGSGPGARWHRMPCLESAPS